MQPILTETSEIAKGPCVGEVGTDLGHLEAAEKVETEANRQNSQVTKIHGSKLKMEGKVGFAHSQALPATFVELGEKILLHVFKAVMEERKDMKKS